MAYIYTKLSERVSIDRAAKYGYWERKDGSEGGGLWFESSGNGRLALTDYDGAYELPRVICETLQKDGIEVAAEFWPEGKIARETAPTFDEIGQAQTGGDK